ncbi:MAG: lipid-A-disaccharide synthase [Gammaproteobacteria bacterium]
MSPNNRQQTYKIMFSAGEASGDRHAAQLFLEMRKHLPSLQAIGMGAKQMREAGIDIRYDSSHIGVIGVFEVVRHYAEIRRALQLMQNTVKAERPDLLICVDYKEFNYKLARFAKQCGVKVLFYVSPQVWAWRAGRVKKFGAVIDMMAVIFPFETAYYEAEKIPVRYVGHPSVDKAHPLYSKADDFARFGLIAERPVVGLLPGSRRNEIKRLLPEMLRAAEIVEQTLPKTQFLLPQADSISDELLQRYLQTSPLEMRVIKHQPYDVMQCCDAIMTASGTATLEVALLTVPMVIAYKLAAATYILGRLLVKTPFIGLPNIIAGKSIVRELIQQEASAEKLAAETIKMLTDGDYAAKMRADLKKVKENLGEGGGSTNMAAVALEMLNVAPH